MSGKGTLADEDIEIAATRTHGAPAEQREWERRSGSTFEADRSTLKRSATSVPMKLKSVEKHHGLGARDLHDFDEYVDMHISVDGEGDEAAAPSTRVLAARHAQLDDLASVSHHVDVHTKSLRRSQTMDTTSMRAKLQNTPTGMVTRGGGLGTRDATV